MVRFLWALPTIVKIVLMISSSRSNNMIMCQIMMLMCSNVALTVYPTLKLLDGSALPDVARKVLMILWVCCNLRVINPLSV